MVKRAAVKPSVAASRVAVAVVRAVCAFVWQSSNCSIMLTCSENAGSGIRRFSSAGLDMFFIVGDVPVKEFSI